MVDITTVFLNDKMILLNKTYISTSAFASPQNVITFVFVDQGPKGPKPTLPNPQRSL